MSYPPSLQKIDDPAISASGVNLFILRLDQIHPHISGNKWYKLKYNMEEVRRQRAEGIITFGGAYSNHIAATAAAGKEFGIKTIGIIRGDELASPSERSPSDRPSPKEREEQPLNPTLRFAKDCGMQLHFVPRQEYQKKEASPLIHSIIKSFNNWYLLPEGGTNELAIKGCAEILSLIDIPFDFVCCPVGTGGTLTGIISSLTKNQQALGFSVLKAADHPEKDIRAWLLNQHISTSANWHISHEYHFGGYGKYTPELLKFIDAFEKQTSIPLDQVYTSKMMFGIYDLIEKKHFPKNSTVIAIHTGGLQGKLKSHPNPPQRRGD